VWRQFTFREDLAACEDKEWSWRVLSSGRTIAYSPRLEVPTAHRRAAGLRPLADRVSREAEAMVSLGAAEPLTPLSLLQTWWRDFPISNGRPLMIRRFSPFRTTELYGAWRGSRTARRLPPPLLGDFLADAGLSRKHWQYLPWA
jgi:hypothetical protein